MKNLTHLIILILFFQYNATAQENINKNKFRQLKSEFATPNTYRTASGAPGHEYWQQKADYVINIRLDEEKKQISGEETITYHNQSPDALNYLWLQLDQNMRSLDSDTKKIQTGNLNSRGTLYQIQQIEAGFEGGFKIEYVKDKNGNDLAFTINKTMMRVDLPTKLNSGNSFSFSIKWWYNINNRITDSGRSGYEYFAEDDNSVFTIAQFYPRMAVYNEVEGWQHKQFLGEGEFTLPFGDFEVNLTVPADHIVGATGELQNENEVLTRDQINRLKKAKKSDNPVIIVTQTEAEIAEKSKSSDEKTWTYKATNVRDFAFASSRKFIWDAMGVEFGERTVMAMSLYPKEGNPLWEDYSTKVVAHTLKTYSKYTFDYPYPTAISVNSTRGGGMEYPMISFNGGRPQRNGEYDDRVKYSTIGVIIHEIGHNYFPMIINSDERQWAWMDEGINTFVEFLAEQEWENGFPSTAGEAYKIVPYMRADKRLISPIMTNPESVRNLGYNAYFKPATALNILRETIMGKELFDYAFKEYAMRWKFKHPMPEDFFRTMEDASGVDLDWFWRGWFYTTDHVDISLENVKWLDTGSIGTEDSISETNGNAGTEDSYSNLEQYKVTEMERRNYDRFLESLSDEQQQKFNGKNHYYQIDFKNIGGLVMPIILEFEFADQSKEMVKIPAEIWQVDNENVSKVFKFNKMVVNIRLDPNLETADTDLSNNFWPRRTQQIRNGFNRQQPGSRN